MGQIRKVYLIEDNNLTAMNTIDALKRAGYEVQPFDNLSSVIEEYKDESFQKNQVCIVSDLNLPVRGSGLTIEEKNKSNFGSYAGWIYLHKHFLKPNIDKSDDAIPLPKKIILYSAYINILLSEYFNEYPDEKKAYEEHVTFVDKNESSNAIETLIEEIEK